MKYFCFSLLLLSTFNVYDNYFKGYTLLTAASILCCGILIDLAIRITQEEGE